MCNLSQGIRDDANAKVIMNMYKKGYTLQQIAEIVEKNIGEVDGNPWMHCWVNRGAKGIALIDEQNSGKIKYVFDIFVFP